MNYVPFLRLNPVQHSTQVILSVAAVMFVLGLVSLLYGWRLYKFLVVVSTALAGACLGWYLANGYGLLPPNLQFIAPLVLGVVGAVAAIPLQRAAVFFIGASVGFVSLGPVIAELIWRPPEQPTTTQYLFVSVLAFIVMGILSLLLFRVMVTIATSLFGATLTLSAAVQALQALWYPTRDFYAFYPAEMAAIFLALAVLGVIFQVFTAKKKKKEK